MSELSWLQNAMPKVSESLVKHQCLSKKCFCVFRFVIPSTLGVLTTTVCHSVESASELKTRSTRVSESDKSDPGKFSSETMISMMAMIAMQEVFMVGECRRGPGRRGSSVDLRSRGGAALRPSELFTNCSPTVHLGPG